MDADVADFWRVEELGGMEMLHSRGVDPAHAKHMHESFAIGVVDGGVVVNQSRGETTYLPAGSVFTFNPGEVHSGYAADALKVSHRSFYPTEEAVGDLARALDLAGTPVFRTTHLSDPRSAARLRRLHELLKHSEDTLERQTATFRVLGALLQHHTSLRGSLAEGREPRAVAQVRAYLEAHYRENVSLDELAALVGLNGPYLTRTFCRAVGVPPHKYLIYKRIERAKELLRAGESTAQVALMVGFSDQSHLNLHFKRLLNVTPARYAKSQFLPRKAI